MFMNLVVPAKDFSSPYALPIICWEMGGISCRVKCERGSKPAPTTFELKTGSSKSAVWAAGAGENKWPFRPRRRTLNHAGTKFLAPAENPA
jgi:hypothetical protein